MVGNSVFKFSLIIICKQTVSSQRLHKSSTDYLSGISLALQIILTVLMYMLDQKFFCQVIYSIGQSKRNKILEVNGWQEGSR